MANENNNATLAELSRLLNSQTAGSSAPQQAEEAPAPAPAPTPAPAPAPAPAASSGTQVDQGWRANMAAAERAAEAPAPAASSGTQVDQGWRANMAAAERAAEAPAPAASSGTQVDQGWRANMAAAERAAEAPAPAASSGTQVDQGWRANMAAAAEGRQSTQVDQGWRANAESMLGSGNGGGIVANYFPSKDAFNAAVAQLPQLTSSTGKVYPVKETLSTAGGEGIVLTCSDPEGNDVVAKVYFTPANSADSSLVTRSQIIEFMGTPAGQSYTIPIDDIGFVEFGQSSYYFEIMPFCKDGDVSDDGAYSFEDLVVIVRQLNEALHSIHSANIIHRDIKPQNIFKMPHGVVFGDFGTARIADTTTPQQTTHVVKSRGYTAPEMLLGLSNNPTFIYTAKIDYYSLGVTIASLYEGRFIYEGMDDNMMTLCVQKGKMPLRRQDAHRQQIENLITGLVRFDSRYRFGYEEVNKWLADHNYTGGSLGEEWPKGFRMLNEEYRDEESMFQGFTRDLAHWKEASEMLYRKFVEQFFSTFRTDLARAAQVTDETYRRTNPDKGLAVFLKTLFAPGPIVWKGLTFKSLGELATAILAQENAPGFQDLLKNDVVSAMAIASQDMSVYSEMLTSNCISHWLANTEGISVDDQTKRLVDQIERCAINEPDLACYWFANAFAPERQLRICNRTVTNIAELIQAMFSSANDFYQLDAFDKLTSRTTGADLYGFLFSLGYKDVVEKSWAELKHCDTFHKTAILLAMMDNIAEKAQADTKLVRKFFVDYGPVGIATYTKKLAADGQNVYKALDSAGHQALSAITKFKAPAEGNVDTLFRSYTPLIQSVEKLQRILIQNPHLVLSGAYEETGVICTNLKGSFAFKIFDRPAPLGFHAWIESAKGGSK